MKNLFFAFSTQTVMTPKEYAAENLRIDTFFLESLITSEPPKYKDICFELSRIGFETNDLDAKKRAKDAKNKLPYALFSGFCPVHHNNESLEYNGCVQIDIDFKRAGGNTLAVDLKARIVNMMHTGLLPYMVFCAVSPSGYGVKCLISTDNTSKERHSQLVKTLIKELSVLFDLSESDFDSLSLSQPCFIPYDKTAYFNHTANQYHYTHVENVVKKVVKTEPQATLINNGTSAFILSIAQKLSLCEAITDTYSLNGRNDRTFRVACLAAQNSIEFDDVLNACLCFEESDFSAKEILQCVKSAFKTAKNKDFNDFQLYSYALRSGATIPREIQNLYENRKQKTDETSKLPDVIIEQNYKIYTEKIAYQKINGVETNIVTQNNVVYNPIVVNKYLDEAREKIVNILHESKHLYIHGHPELGKTTLFKNLSKDETALNFLGVERVIIAAPRVMLATELQKSTDSVIARGSHFSEMECRMNDEKLIITNIDNLKKVGNMLEDSILICDEVHKFTQDSPFRGVHNDVFELMQRAKYVVFMTATPDLNICKYLNFSYLHCSSKYRTENKKFNVSYIPCNDYMAGYMSNIAANPSKRHVVFHDSKDKLEIAKIELQKMGLKSTIISRETCEDVVQAGLENLKNNNVILCTSIADAGIDMKFRVDMVHCRFSMPPNDMVQAINRGRGSENFVTDVLCYHSEKQSENGQQKPSKMSPKEVFYQDGDDYRLLFYQHIAKAKDVCTGLNQLFDLKLIEDIAPQFANSVEKLTYYSKKTKKYEIDIGYCSFLANKKPCSIEQHFAEISEIDTAICMDTQSVILNEGVTDGIKEAVNERKDFNKRCRDIARRFILRDLGNAVFFVSRYNEDARKWLKNNPFDESKAFFPTEYLPTEGGDDVSGESKAVETIVHAFMKRFFEILKYIKDYDSTYFCLFSDDAYRLEIRRLVTQYREKQKTVRLSPKDQKAKFWSQKLASELSKYRKNTEIITVKDLKKMVSNIYPVVVGTEWYTYAYSVTNIEKNEERCVIGKQVSFDECAGVFYGEREREKQAEKEREKAEKKAEKEREKAEKKAQKPSKSGKKMSKNDGQKTL